VFKPALLGRMVVIPYFPVRDEVLKQIVRLKLGKVQRRIAETHRIPLAFDEALVQAVADRCTEVESGARNVDNILTNTLLPEISLKLLERIAVGEKLTGVRVSVGESGFAYAWDASNASAGAGQAVASPYSMASSGASAAPATPA